MAQRERRREEGRKEGREATRWWHTRHVAQRAVRGDEWVICDSSRGKEAAKQQQNRQETAVKPF